ncbi:hypothetical protein [Shewanella surugensis]|uniref:Uncharacterized protein n=1 Tax=Shewanella surugensis TaxID=212020 RepID=A0ABT0LIW9_9GAMM|nr:hypothetical protein [Shewanella surugensis]MCL1127071.1 hypothetical protein [Shewanella surugensis]
MRKLATPGNQVNFSIQTFGKIGDEQANIVLNINSNGHNHTLLSTLIEGQSDVTYCIEQSYKMATQKCIHDAKVDFRKYSEGGDLSLDSYILSKIQCMSDDKEMQKTLEHSLESSKYSSDNFLKCTPNKDNSTFTAHFRNGETLVLSNRLPTNGEFRGDNLKEALTNGTYSNLQELTSRGHLTHEDSMLEYALAAPKLNLLSTIEPQGMKHSITSQLLHNTPVANTTLGKLFGLPEPSIVSTDGLQQCQTTTKGVRIQKALTEDTQAGLAQLTAEIHNSKASSHSFGGFRLFS